MQVTRLVMESNQLELEYYDKQAQWLCDYTAQMNAPMKTTFSQFSAS